MTNERPARAKDEAPAPEAASRIESQELFAGNTEVIIDHEGDRYRLRLTSKGKLILTK